MFRKAVISVSFTLALLMAASVAAMAQLAPLSGRVVMDQGGKKVPVAGALVEVYRTDIKGTLPSAKTDKNGGFQFAGVPITGTFVLSVSAPSIQPQIFPGIKGGTDAVLLNVVAGNGEKFTEDQVRQGASMSTNGGGELTPEQKKQQAEYEAKRKEAEAKNESIKKSTEVIKTSFQAGNQAMAAKNWDTAIQKYDEGIAADPQFVGSVPALSNNRGIAFMNKAVEERNAAIKLTDPTAKTEGLAKAKQDLDESIASFAKAWAMLKSAAPSEELPKANLDAGKMGALLGTRDALKLAARVELVDDKMMDSAKTMIPEYLAVETDAAKKADAQLVIADLYRVNGDYASAVDAYKKVLESSPDNPDALVGAGLCLFAMGAVNNNDKNMYQEGANYLQKYVSVAPEGHKFKADAQAILEQLKNEQKVTPQKVPTTSPGRKKPGSN